MAMDEIYLSNWSDAMDTTILQNLDNIFGRVLGSELLRAQMIAELFHVLHGYWYYS